MKTFMRNRPAAVVNAFLVAAVFAVAFWTIDRLPGAGQVAIHWGPDNRPDAWIGGAAVQLVNPIVALVIWFLMCAAPQRFAAPGKSPDTVHARLSVVFQIQLAVQLLIAIYALGWSPF
ncbi:hypothetical protein ACFQ09_15665 [Massilia norwichensis]|uniref:DUF1648 domain-containing protein n=1 Tax=Massilia norwichensis TaxID=1442366 RepID=A0ABT2A6U1_9BURK|nr:hypothetical protein [Massilia norwichensis]MCS0589873.1 hypothetical protein [Massilia norwichensis]